MSGTLLSRLFRLFVLPILLAQVERRKTTLDTEDGTPSFRLGLRARGQGIAIPRISGCRIVVRFREMLGIIVYGILNQSRLRYRNTRQPNPVGFVGGTLRIRAVDVGIREEAPGYSALDNCPED